jgi:transcriptional regulator with XRE-family HTH domain
VFTITLGEKIHQLRKERGLSQEQLASKVTVSRQAISKWELGEAVPDVHNIVQLSKLFNVSTDYLLLDDNYINTKTSLNISTMSSKSTTEQETKQNYHPKTRMIFGGILVFLGFCGVLIFWIVSILNPVVYIILGSDSDTAYTGLRAFLLSRNATGLFIFCCLVGVVGLVLISYPYLRDRFQLDKRMNRAIKEFKNEMEAAKIKKERKKHKKFK